MYLNIPVEVATPELALSTLNGLQKIVCIGLFGLAIFEVLLYCSPATSVYPGDSYTLPS